MALNAAALANLIVNNVTGTGVEITAPEELQKFAESIAEAVVDHITSAAAVAGNAVVASGSSAGTWPVTGTIS